MNQLYKIFIFIGFILIVIGLLWSVMTQFRLGHFPGDIIIRRKSFTFYFPIVTSVLISLLINLLFWLLKR